AVAQPALEPGSRAVCPVGRLIRTTRMRTPPLPTVHPVGDVETMTAGVRLEPEQQELVFGNPAIAPHAALIRVERGRKLVGDLDPHFRSVGGMVAGLSRNVLHTPEARIVARGGVGPVVAESLVSVVEDRFVDMDLTLVEPGRHRRHPAPGIAPIEIVAG